MPIGLGTAVAVGAGVSAAGALGGALINSSATDSASKASSQAADKSLAVQQQQYGDTKANNAPYLNTGTSALDRLANIYGLDQTGATGGTGGNIDPNATFYQSPDYQFNLSQGIKGVDAGASATGSLDSGATRKAEIAYGGNLASSQFNNYAARLQSLAGIGQAAANSQAASGLGYANAYTNTVTNAANNQANAGLAGASAISNGLNSTAGLLQNYLAGNTKSSSYSAPTGSVGTGYGGTNYGGNGSTY